MKTIELTSDAKTILMRGRFPGGRAPESARPLTLTEYNHLADWMMAHSLHPQSLMTDDGKQMLDRLPPKIEVGRIDQPAFKYCPMFCLNCS